MNIPTPPNGDKISKLNQSITWLHFVGLVQKKKKKSKSRKTLSIWSFSPKGWGFGSGATLWDYALHITSILKTRQLSRLPQCPHLLQMNSDRSRDRSRAWWWKKVGKREKTMLQFVFFKMNALLTHVRKPEMNTNFPPTLEGIILKGCHTTTNTNVI